MRTALFSSLVLVACSGAHSSDADLCTARRPGDLVITEFLADPSGTDSGKEWFEVFNRLDVELELAGFTLFSADKTHLVRTGTIGPRGYFVFGDVRSGVLPAFEGYSYGNELGELPQSGGHFGVRCKDTVIDEVTYTVAAKPGHARQLDGRAEPAASGESQWCDANVALDGGNFGTPSAPNTFCSVAGDAGCTVAPGDLEISEVMANPRAVSDSAGEWIEVHALNACDLRGLSLGSGSSSALLRGDGCIHLEAGEWAVLAKSFDAGLPNIRATFSNSLLNSASTVALSLGDAGIASVDVPAAIDGVSWQRDASGAFCAATVTYETGDFGTPGASNTACAATMSSAQCIDALSMQPRDVRRPSRGDLAITEWMPDPTAVADNAGEWIELHAFRPVDLNGLVVNGASTLSSASCLSVDAGQLVVIARSADPAKNGGLSAVTATFGVDLVNSGGTVSLSLPDGGLLDSLTYPAASHGASFFVDGARCDPLQYVAPPSVCVTPVGVTYGGGDRGTPGAINGACP
ncbi:MAG: hypothetical protein QM723_21290 [Myxococcaceae bacterium]